MRVILLAGLFLVACGGHHAPLAACSTAAGAALASQATLGEDEVATRAVVLAAAGACLTAGGLYVLNTPEAPCDRAKRRDEPDAGPPPGVLPRDAGPVFGPAFNPEDPWPSIRGVYGDRSPPGLRHDGEGPGWQGAADPGNGASPPDAGVSP